MPASAPTFQVPPNRSVELSPEMQLLCLSARSSLSVENKDRIERLLASAPLNWTEVVCQAEWHGTAPLLLMNLSQQTPAGAAKQLKQICQVTAQQSLLLAAELLRALDALRIASVKAIPYKGPVLAEAVYGNLALRRAGDLDLLVSFESFEPAKRALKALGYMPRLALSHGQESRYVRAQCALDFVNPENGIALDLHCEIASRHLAIALKLQPMLERAIEVPLAGRLVPMLQPEDLVAVLCVHGSKHGWERLGWICDLAQTLLAYPDLDWELMLSRAQAGNVRRMLLLGLMLAKALLEAELPANVEALCQEDRALPGLAAQVGLSLEDGATEPINAARRWVFLLRTRERYRDRAWALARYAFTPGLEEWKPSSASAALYPLLCAIRPLRVASRIASRQTVPARKRANIQTV